MASLRGGLQLPVLVVIAVLRCGTAQFQCHDNATTNCTGNEVTGVSTARECCLGGGFWFQMSGSCMQCIVHGFERTVVSVDEGAMPETLVIRLDIKGNTLDESPQSRVSDIHLTVRCQDVTTESDDYNTTACSTQVWLNPAERTSEVNITFPADYDALEGTEILLLSLANTQTQVTSARNIFFQDTSIQIRDTTVLRAGFAEEDYEGNEGPDRQSTLPNMPCTVAIRLQNDGIEAPLMFRLIPQTIPENIDADGPSLTVTLTRANASRMDFNDTQPFEVTMAAGTTVVTAGIPIVDDEINEAGEEFVVVLEVVSNITNPVEFTAQTTVCRIPQNDPIEIGFTRARVEHNESRLDFFFVAYLEKDRQSEQTFVIRIEVNISQVAPATPLGREAPSMLPDFFVITRVVTMTPEDDDSMVRYVIFDDNIPENTESFRLSAIPNPGTPSYGCDGDCFQELQVLILDDDGDIDFPDLRLGFEAQGYTASEIGGRCHVTVILQPSTFEVLRLRLIPRTFPENVAANGPLPNATCRGVNASRMDFNDTQPFEVTMAAGSTVVTADIPVVDDEINEAEEEFVVVLEVVSNTTNPVVFTTQTTVCRIPPSDPIEIGFTQERVEHNESNATFSEVIVKTRLSEQTFNIQVRISTPRILGLGEPATLGDDFEILDVADFQIGDVLNVTLTPDDNETKISYQIFEDQVPERTEIFLVTTRAFPGSPAFGCDDNSGLQDCFPELQVSVNDNDVVVVGFVETLVEVNETDGTAALNVSIRSPPSDVALGFEIILRVNTMDGSARSSAGFCRDSDRVTNDFICISQSLELGNALRSQTVSVDLRDDLIPETEEELTVSLSLQDMELATSVNVTPAEATIIIQDNDILAEFNVCYDNAATDCNGTEIPNVITARNCCLGDGFWFHDVDGGCHQCIVHGFVNTSLMVDEGSEQQIIPIRRNIKGNTSADNRIDFTVICNDNTTERGDYSTRACKSTARLRQNDAAQVAVDFLQDDSVALEGTEELVMELQVSQKQQSIFTTAGNIFIRNVSIIQIRDITTITLGFSQAAYEGNESPDQACRVNISLQDTTIEAPLTLRLIPRTIPENFDVNGPLLTTARRGANASRMDFNGTQFEVTIEAGNTSVTADIPIVDDDINEAEEEFVVVLEVVSNTTNPVEFTTQTTVCRIPENDRIEIGFTQERVYLSDHESYLPIYAAVIEKSRQSEQTFRFRIETSTPRIPGLGEPATQFVLVGLDAQFGDFLVADSFVVLGPSVSEARIRYFIVPDGRPERTEIFEIVSCSLPDNPAIDCDNSSGLQDCCSVLQVLIVNDDVLDIGFDETLVEVDESDGQASLNVRIVLSDQPSEFFDQPSELEITFSLFASTVDGSAGSRPCSAIWHDPMAGIEDYQQICNNTARNENVMTLEFSNTQRSQTFNVTIFDDDVPEGVEEFFVALSLQDQTLVNTVNVTPAVATVRIWDNDRIVVGFDRTTYMVNETDEQVELCVIVSVPEDQNIGNVTFSLAVETQNGTARGTVTVVTDMGGSGSVSSGMVDTGIGSSGTVDLGIVDSGILDSGADYISAMTTLDMFSTQQPKQCFNVTIINDSEIEIIEDFFATLTLLPDTVTTVDPNRTIVDPSKATVSIMDNDVRMTPVPSVASTHLRGLSPSASLPHPSPSASLPHPSPSASLPHPSPSTSPTRIIPVSSTNLWPVLFAPLAVVLLVLLIVAVTAIVYYKRRRRDLNLKIGLNKESSPEECRTERVYKARPLASHRPSVQLRRMLPHRMIIPSSVLKLQDSIGQGEFGVVYKANLQWHLDAATEVVAVKTLKGLFTPNDVDSLVQEVLKMHTLSHPNVMSLTGVCLDTGGGPAVVMPFMGRGSVLHYLKKERGNLVPPDDADCSVISDVQRQLLGMCLQISKGMEYLAKESIVHRDLAARNCMMDASGVIKVADFGLSEDIYTNTYYRQKKSDNAVKLPVRWMPPESIADGMFTEKSDVWSFGVTCWEVFTGGHIPYSGISPVALLQLLRNGERLNKPMNPACSDEIYAIILDCWKEEPKERPDFSKLVETISLTLEAAAGYMEFSLCVKNEHPQVAAEMEVKTTADDSSVQQETAM